MTRILFAHPLSANSRRVRIMLSILKLPFEERLVDLARGEQRRPELLALNPNGQVPVLVDDELTLWESHAILVYLARRYGDESWLPVEPKELYLVLRWLFFDANELHNGIGMARNHFMFKVPLDGEAALRRARHSASLVEAHLAGRTWLELERPTLADLACAPFFAVAEEGRVPLAEFPRVTAWLDRCGALANDLRQPRKAAP